MAGPIPEPTKTNGFISDSVMKMHGLDVAFFDDESSYQSILRLVRAHHAQRTADSIEAVKKNLDVLRALNSGSAAVNDQIQGGQPPEKTNAQTPPLPASVPAPVTAPVPVPPTKLAYSFYLGNDHCSNSADRKDPSKLLPTKLDELEGIKTRIASQQQEVQLLQQQLLSTMQDAVSKESNLTTLQASITEIMEKTRPQSVLQKF
jgi:hypothetical protein